MNKRRHWHFLSAAFSALVLAKGAFAEESMPLSYMQGEPMHIGNEVQYLMDDYMVEDRWKLTRRVGKVEKHLGNPVIVQDQSWEDNAGAYPSVLFDPVLGKFRMWYQIDSLTNYFNHKRGPAYAVGYAESDNGFIWTKPRLEGFPFGTSARSNVVTAGRNGRGANGIQVMFNPDTSDPQKRLMMVCVGWESVDLAYSPDGLHWTVREKPLVPAHLDFSNHLLWVPETKLWYLYLRPSILPNGWSSPRTTHLVALPEGMRHTGRRLSMSTSPDLENWSVQRTFMYPDELTPSPDYDNASVFRRHGLFISFYSQMFMEQGGSETELHVATSRDGIHWDRTWDRQPLVPRGLPGSFDHGQVEPGASAPVDVGDDMLIYYWGSPAGQSNWSAEGAVGIARLRLDRFVGQVAGDQTGFLLTRQFVLEGNALRINCVSHPQPYANETDGIRVAIIAAPDYKTKETTWETAVPGFSLGDSDRIITDEIEHVVTWKGKSDLSSLRGRAVYLRFQMKHAELYTFQVTQEDLK